MLDAERARAYLWEYRYLNHFLAFHTQQVLDWFASLPNRTSMALFDSVWLPLIPSTDERRAIITALQAHYLILVQNELVEVTPKGARIHRVARTVTATKDLTREMQRTTDRPYA